MHALPILLLATLSSLSLALSSHAPSFEITDLSIRITNISPRRRYLHYTLSLLSSPSSPPTTCTGSFNHHLTSLDNEPMICSTTSDSVPQTSQGKGRDGGRESEFLVRIHQPNYLPEQAGFSILIDSIETNGVGGRGRGRGKVEIPQGLPGWNIQRNASYLIDEYTPGSGAGMPKAVVVEGGWASEDGRESEGGHHAEGRATMGGQKPVQRTSTQLRPKKDERREELRRRR